jgi:hypothetical protein
MAAALVRRFNAAAGHRRASRSSNALVRPLPVSLERADAFGPLLCPLGIRRFHALQVPGDCLYFRR